MKKIWNFINGNKTIIGLFLLMFVDKFAANWFSPDAIEIINWVLTTLTGASLAHKLQKKAKNGKPKK